MTLASLIPAGVSILGGLLGGGSNKSKTESTPTLTPEMDQAVKDIFARIPQIFNKPFPEYPGERVAGPTDSRSMMDPIMSMMQQRMTGRMNQPNPYGARVDQLLNMPPPQVQVGDLLGRQPNVAQVHGGYNAAPPTQIQQPPQMTSAPWLSGQTVQKG
jgi:hypothetical protein